MYSCPPPSLPKWRVCPWITSSYRYADTFMYYILLLIRMRNDRLDAHIMQMHVYSCNIININMYEKWYTR